MKSVASIIFEKVFPMHPFPALVLAVCTSILLFSYSVTEAASQQSAERGLRWSLAFAPVYEGDADLDDGGEIGVERYQLRADVKGSLTRRVSWGAAASYALHDYDFSGQQGLGLLDPWDRVHTYDLGVSLDWRFAEIWSLRLNPSIEFAGEDGAAWSDSEVYGGTLLLMRRFGSRLSLGIGVSASSGLEEDKVFPVAAVIWQISDRLRLANSFRQGPGSPAGLELAYTFPAGWEAGLGASYRSQRFRLDDEGVAPEGIGESESGVGWLRVTRAFGGGLSLDLWLGAVFAGEIILEDDDGNELRSEDYDPAPMAAVTVLYRF